MAQRSRSSRSPRDGSSRRSSSRGSSSRSGSSRSGSSRSGSARPGSSRGAGRGSSRGGYGGAKKSNPGPTIAAVGIVLVLIVLLIVVFGSGKKDEDDSRKTSTSRTPRRTFKPVEDEAPKGPTRLAPPSLAPEAKDMAEQLVEQAKELAAQGEALYQEANEAKKAGDDDLWQEKLKEAAAYYREILDAYNDLVAQMPTNKDWDEEQVANYYLGSQASQIQKHLSRLTDIQKQRRR